MPRPTNKNELLQLSELNFQRLFNLVDSYSEEKRYNAFPEGMLNRNISDVLCHLHHWHKLLLNWYTEGMKGLKPDMPAKGYSWKNTSALNKKIWEKYRKTDLNEAKKLLRQSHEKIQELIHQHTDNELFEKKKYPWTGSTSLGAYLISSTSSHYDWAYKLIRKVNKNR